jgi:hypothetical protein
LFVFTPRISVSCKSSGAEADLRGYYLKIEAD